MTIPESDLWKAVIARAWEDAFGDQGEDRSGAIRFLIGGGEDRIWRDWVCDAANVLPGSKLRSAALKEIAKHASDS